MKGIILAGGAGTRLYPLTLTTSKQLLPVYDKPMIYYPLSTLMLAGIRDILIISTPEDTPRFEKLLGNGKRFGINLEYKVQESPDGLAQALIIGEEFIGNDSCAMILGDNIFFGNGLVNMLRSGVQKVEEDNDAVVFAYYVKDPERFGVIEFDNDRNVLSIEEKPKKPKSNYAVTGLYFYPPGVSKLAKEVVPSDRGELEITSLNEMYLKQSRLDVELFGRGYSWFDTGTVDSLLDASVFIASIEKHQGIKTAVPEEIANRLGWLSNTELEDLVKDFGKSSYGNYLREYIKRSFI